MNYYESFILVAPDSAATHATVPLVKGGRSPFPPTGSADGKTITQKGHYDDPIEGPMKLRSVTKMVDNDTEIFEMYGTGKNGKERKMMEITYTRKP